MIVMSIAVRHVSKIGCAERIGKTEKGAMTINPVYGCEELQRADCVYDDVSESHYDDLNENAIYLDVLGDEIDELSRPPLPTPRPVTPIPIIEAQDLNQDHDYEGTKETETDHIYI